MSKAGASFDVISEMTTFGTQTLSVYDSAVREHRSCRRRWVDFWWASAGSMILLQEKEVLENTAPMQNQTVPRHQIIVVESQTWVLYLALHSGTTEWEISCHVFIITLSFGKEKGALPNLEKVHAALFLYPFHETWRHLQKKDKQKVWNGRTAVYTEDRELWQQQPSHRWTTACLKWKKATHPSPVSGSAVHTSLITPVSICWLSKHNEMPHASY